MSKQRLVQGAKELVGKLVPGDLVLIAAFPVSPSKWGGQPGVVVEKYLNDNVLVCPITDTQRMGGVSIGPQRLEKYCGIQFDVLCDEPALNWYPSYVNLLSSMTLGEVTSSPYRKGKVNWISPLGDSATEESFCLSRGHTTFLREALCRKRCELEVNSQGPHGVKPLRVPNGYKLGHQATAVSVPVGLFGPLALGYPLGQILQNSPGLVQGLGTVAASEAIGEAMTALEGEAEAAEVEPLKIWTHSWTQGWTPEDFAEYEKLKEEAMATLEGEAEAAEVEPLKRWTPGWTQGWTPEDFAEYEKLKEEAMATLQGESELAD